MMIAASILAAALSVTPSDHPGSLGEFGEGYRMKVVIWARHSCDGYQPPALPARPIRKSEARLRGEEAGLEHVYELLTVLTPAQICAGLAKPEVDKAGVVPPRAIFNGRQPVLGQGLLFQTGWPGSLGAPAGRLEVLVPQPHSGKRTAP